MAALGRPVLPAYECVKKVIQFPEWNAIPRIKRLRR